MSKLVKKKIQMGETAATITCDETYLSAVIEGIARARNDLKAYVKDRPDFLLSLEPLDADRDAPIVVKRMCDASEMAGVGPMAAVAGAIAWAGAESAVEAGCSHCIVDNGGDIAIILDRPVTIGIINNIESDIIPAVEIAPTNGKILGICTSSGIYGHSISFGSAEAATAMAKNPALADALATALGNACKDKSSIRVALEGISGIEGVIWAMAIVDGKIGTMGDVPRMLTGKRTAENTTVHSDFPASIAVR